MDAYYEVTPVPKDSGYTSAQRILLTVGALLIILYAMVIVYQYTAYREVGVNDEMMTTQSLEKVAQESEGVALQEVVPVEETFEATLLEISADATYIRTSIEGRGMVSVGIIDASILVNDSSASISELPPFAKLSITAQVLDDTEKYDYQALKISYSQDTDSLLLESANQQLEAKTFITQ